MFGIHNRFSLARAPTPIAFMGNRDDLSDIPSRQRFSLGISVTAASTMAMRIAAVVLVAALICGEDADGDGRLHRGGPGPGSSDRAPAGMIATAVILLAIPLAFVLHPGLRSRAAKMRK